MQLKISENMIYFWKNGHLIIDDFVRHEQYSLELSVFPILGLFKEWNDPDSAYLQLQKDQTLSLTRNEMTEIIKSLREVHILIEKESPEDMKLTNWKEWGTPAKYFHFNTRLLHKDNYLDVNQDYERLINKKKNVKAPSIYKIYDNVEEIPLPTPDFKKEGSFLDVLLKRQTIRSFSEKPITLIELSSILYFVWGAQSCKRDFGVGATLFKTSPSGGARHPIEVYPYISNVTGIKEGLYHYNVQNHSLNVINKEKITDIIDMAAGQKYVKGASVLFFYTACLERSMWKYKTPRVYRIVMMDVGHLSQTFYLVASWLKLGAFFTGHLKDELVEERLGIDKEKEIICGLSGIGHISDEAKKHGRDFRFRGEDLR
ncbi:SagB/ThcOx family dehydrogenase [Bacillus cereus]